MPTYVVPAVYDTTKKVIRPASGCEKISPDYLRLSPRAFISSDTDNSIREGSDGKLICHLVARQRSNLIKLGADFGVYLDSSNILSGGNDNLLTVSASDDRIILTKPMLEQCGFIDATKVNILFRRHIEQITEMKEAAEEAAEESAASATQSAQSATQSANSATQSAQSATQSANSATQSANSATQSAAYANESSTYANRSQSYSVEAANSATAAANSATESATSAARAYDSAISAAQQASHAATAATQASTYATTANTYATRAQSYVSTIENKISTATNKIVETVKNYRDEVNTDRKYVENAVTNVKTVIQDAASTISANAICPYVVEKAADLAVSKLAKVDSIRADLDDLSYETTEAIARLAATDVEQSTWLLELRQHQINNLERFTDLAKVSVANTEAIADMQLEHCESTINMAIAVVSQSIVTVKLYKRLSA